MDISKDLIELNNLSLTIFKKFKDQVKDKALQSEIEDEASHAIHAAIVLGFQYGVTKK